MFNDISIISVQFTYAFLFCLVFSRIVIGRENVTPYVIY